MRPPRRKISALGQWGTLAHGQSFLTDEIEDAIDPNSPFIRGWHHLLLVCVLYEAFLIPFFVVFKPDAPHTLPSELYIAAACEVVFLVDVVVQAHTGFYEDGNIVRDCRRTRKRYLRSGRLVIDLVTLIPFSLFPIHVSVARSALEGHKLLRAIKISTYWMTIDDLYAKQFVVVKLVKVLVFTIYLSHFIACLRRTFGFDDKHENHWLPPHPTSHDTVRREYVMSVFWAFGVLTGLFEGELPHHISEFIFTMFVAICGFSLFTTLCAMFFMISKCESGNEEAAQAKINQLKHILSFHHVPEYLQLQAIEFLRRLYTDDVSSDQEVMRLLCPSISKDVQVELMKATVRQIPIFEGCSESFIVAASSLLEFMSIPSQTVLFKSGDVGDCMYIVHSGVLNVIINGVTVREIRKGTCFGELSVFSASPRSATIVSATYSTLYKLSRFHGEKLMEGYPDCALIIRSTVAALLNRDAVPAQHNSGNLASSQQRAETSHFEQLGAHLRQKMNGMPVLHWGKKNASYIVPGQLQSQSNDVSDRGDTVNEGMPDRMASYYDRKIGVSKVSGIDSATPWLWRQLLLRRCIDTNSRRRMLWLLILQFVLIYNWIVIPLQLCFPVFKDKTWYISAGNAIADLILYGNIYVNFNLAFVADSEKIVNTYQSAMRYIRGGFVFDLICAFPFWIFAPSSDQVFFRFPRLLVAQRWSAHFAEVDHYFHLTNRQHLIFFGILLIMLYHTTACLFFGITNIEGFSSKDESWLPSEDVFLEKMNTTHFIGANHTILPSNDPDLRLIATTQYFRSLYYATNVLAALGKTIEPDSEVQYSVALVFMLSGFLITAIVVDHVQKRFTATALEHKQFYANRMRIQLFLRRQNAPLAIYRRVNAFLDFWWSSHRGAFINELIADLPVEMKREILRSICAPALQTIALLSNVRSVLERLEDFVISNGTFILYGQGEVVYRQGDYATGMFFLLEGTVCVITNAENPREAARGEFFGTAALDETDGADGYAEHVSATSGCILLFVSRHHMAAIKKFYPELSFEMIVLEERLLKNKFAKKNIAGHGNRRSTIIVTPKSKYRMLKHWSSVAFDPDSPYILIWETWLFVAMTVQWMTVIFQMCFRMKKQRYLQADIATAFLECSFLADIFIRSRLGFYAFGNKVMDIRRIRQTYFRSTNFVIDLIALIPLFVVNWWRSPSNRLDALNINKLFRLFKVPSQLRAIENRFLKLTSELRLFKLFYYTFMLSHIFGCMWFDFASNSSRLFATSTQKETEFGADAWLPPATLEGVELNMQYFASIFWSFGLMSASSTGELPKTAHECGFSVITMTSGFFLFAYVIGNFTDIIELVDGDNREFNERLASIRLLLSHFTLPRSIEERLKTYFQFKRFHTITQEFVLERCLPPTLLTDIRLVHLKPMISKVTFLSGMEGSVTRMLVSQFRQMLVLRDQFVCKIGEEGYDMYFVFTGILDVLLPDAANNEPEEVIDRENYVDLDDYGNPRLKKVNELNAGSYFGENGLFMNGRRNAFIRAKTSCILYRLSRESLELVFERYPMWKEKVLRIANLQQEQRRLAHLTAEEQQRHSDEMNGSMLSRIDILNQRAEQMEEDMRLVRFMRRETRSRVKDHDQLGGGGRCRKYTLDVVLRILTTLMRGAEAQSSFHINWLRLVVFATVYTAVIIPYRIAIDPLSQFTGVAPALTALQLACEVIFAVDIWFSWHVTESIHSMELYEQSHRNFYRKERMMWDILAAVPFDRMLLDFTGTEWFELLHCLKILNIVTYLRELNRRSVSPELNRFRSVCLIYGLCIFWSACAYLAVSSKFGFADDWNSWRPHKSLEVHDGTTAETTVLRLLRGLFFGTTAFVKKGKTFTPDSSPLYVFSVCVCYVGLLVMAFMIGEFATLFISSIWNEVNFRKNHIAVELFLGRLSVSDDLKRRTHAFMSSLWSSHSGVNFETIFEEMPGLMRSACIMHIAHRPLHGFTSSAFRLLTCDSTPELHNLTKAIAQKLRFEGYPKDEDVVSEGSISHAMYFVVKGYLARENARDPELSRVMIRRGDFFGDQGLLGCGISSFTVRTIRACDLLSLSSEALLSVIHGHNSTNLALGVAHEACGMLQCQRQLAGCARKEMEVQWGTALLTSVNAHLQTPATDGPVSTLDPEALARVCSSAEECVRAFQPFLRLLFASDPFDWTATFGRSGASSLSCGVPPAPQRPAFPCGEHSNGADMFSSVTRPELPTITSGKIVGPEDLVHASEGVEGPMPRPFDSPPRVYASFHHPPADTAHPPRRASEASGLMSEPLDEGHQD